ncbi:MAG: CBS domain-containing protein [Anaerolineaceae bacterium]
MKTIRHILQLKGYDIWCITSTDTVFNALKLMANKDVGALLVMEKDRLLGIISERDYARKVILVGKSSKETLVSEIMTTEIFTIHPDQTVEECLDLMTEKHIRHAPVIEDDKVIGVVSIGDVVRDIIYNQKKTIKNFGERILT